MTPEKVLRIAYPESTDAVPNLERLGLLLILLSGILAGLLHLVGHLHVCHALVIMGTFVGIKGRVNKLGFELVLNSL